MKFKKIDLENYPRRKHFEYFYSLQYPYVGLTANVDVTELIKFCKERNYSFYLAFIHVVARAADGISEFRQRILNKEIIEYDACPTSHIELLEDGTYCYCTLHHDMPFDEYMTYAENARRECRENRSIDDGEDERGMYFISTMPWIGYTSLTQPVGGGEDSNPRIVWGKFQKDHNGRDQMPLTVLLHHGLVDGIHIAQFYKNVENEILKITDGEGDR